MWIYTKLLPVGWFLIFGLVTLGGFLVPNSSVAVIGALIACFGVIVYGVYIRPLPDHVYLGESEIIINKSGSNTTIPLTEIRNVGYDQKFQVVVLSVRGRGDVRFKPNIPLVGFSVYSSRPKVVEELIDAVDRSRQAKPPQPIQTRSAGPLG